VASAVQQPVGAPVGVEHASEQPAEQARQLGLGQGQG